MKCYKEAEWLALVALAKMKGDEECPLLEDEAVIWAADKIDELEALATHMFMDHEKHQHFQISTYEKAEKLLGLRHEVIE